VGTAQRNFYRRYDVLSVLRFFGRAMPPADCRLVSNGASDWRARGDRANLLNPFPLYIGNQSWRFFEP